MSKSLEDIIKSLNSFINNTLAERGEHYENNDDDISDLLDSLDILNLIHHISETYGLTFGADLEDINSLTNVNTLSYWVLKKL